jgi:hypothetical protein
MPVILATQEADIRRIKVQSQPKQIVHKILARKTLHKNQAGGVAQSEGPELEKPFTKIRLVKWLKVKALSSSPHTAKKQKTLTFLYSLT